MESVDDLINILNHKENKFDIALKKNSNNYNAKNKHSPILMSEISQYTTSSS